MEHSLLDKVSLVSGEQAKRLSGETAPDADVEDRYKITIDIAHQLHCLVRIHASSNELSVYHPLAKMSTLIPPTS